MLGLISCSLLVRRGDEVTQSDPLSYRGLIRRSAYMVQSVVKITEETAYHTDPLVTPIDKQGKR